MDSAERVRLCGERYRQRQAAGKPGWADEASYAQKQERLAALLAFHRLPQPMRFLELGCGNGNVTLAMAQNGHEAWGVDIVPEAIAWAEQQAAQRKLHASFRVDSVVTLSTLEAGRFDLVFDANCLIMVLGQDRALTVRSVWRVLRPGGIFYAEAHLLAETATERVVFGDGDGFDPQGRYSTVRGQPMYDFSREQDFADLIQGAGFRILRQGREAPCASHPDMPFWAGDMWIEACKPG